MLLLLKFICVHGGVNIFRFNPDDIYFFSSLLTRLASSIVCLICDEKDLPDGRSQLEGNRDAVSGGAVFRTFFVFNVLFDEGVAIFLAVKAQNALAGRK